MKFRRDKKYYSSSNEISNISLLAAKKELDSIVGSATFRMKFNELKLVTKYQGQDQNIMISVIMPTWNRAFIITRAIESVLKQTYKNFELIISDDGSSDDTEHVIKTNYSNYNRIKYIKNKHLGVCHARNVALESSKGYLVAYLDSDNQWLDNYLLLMVNSFLENEHIDTAYCGIRVINNVHQVYYTRLQEYDRQSLLLRNYIDLNIFMHKRILYQELGGFNQHTPPLEDWELILRYTKAKPPYVLKCCLANYFFEKELDHLTLSDERGEAYNRIKEMYGRELEVNT